ncbi:armadillo repeat-containing protein 6 homolog [Euwallacea fornicatus]|uniref:armadillo repeat-containing protein 6 homolog n=1 Tax=Euwallacea fornicatus TaxID=995702 RepID=UPI00338DD461
MVLEITQETFDSAVKENVEILGLSEEEALDEAIKQFKAQGVDLGKISTQPMSKKEFENLTTAIEQLRKLQELKGSPEKVNTILEQLKNECDKGLPQKVAAGKADLYYILLNTYETFKDKVNRTNVLKALIALMTKQPDLLDDRGVQFIINNLKDHNQDLSLQCLILKWTKVCCILHELNRQKIFEAHILDILKDFLKDNSPVELIRDTLSLCRALVLDDDVRVEFGKAHEHARIIATETLCSIMSLLCKFKGEEQLNYDIMLTLTALMVRTEFCKNVDDAGGLDCIKSVMESFSSSDKIIRQSFKLIKALAGNDDCKVHMVKQGYAGGINDSILNNIENPQTVTAGLAAIAALTLRNPDNSKAFYEAGAPDVIVNAMKYHMDQKALQKTGSWAIRNMVSRSKYQTGKFLELGVEDVLCQDIQKFKDIEYDIKAALRDLGCNVTLKEEWTGKGGALTTGLTRRDDNKEN